MARTRRYWVIAALLLGSLAGLSAIRHVVRAPDAELTRTRVVLDFAVDFRSAMVQREMEFIDFEGERTRVPPGDVSTGASDRTPHRGVWATGDSSSFEFFASTVDERTLVASCKPFHFPGAPRQRVALAVNGTSVAEVELGPRTAEVRWTIPSRALRIGRNRLQFSYAYSRPPQEVLPDSRDQRPLSVWWDWMRFEGARDGSAPSLDSESRLILPFHSQLDYFVSLPANSVLELGSITLLPALSTAPAGPSGAALVVEIQHDSTGTITQHRLTLSDRFQRLPLGDSDGIVRLSVRGLPGVLAAGVGESALRLTHVRVVAPTRNAPAVPVAAVPKQAPSSRPNVLLFVVDTLRADALGVYGGPPEVSPHIDAFARDAILFSNARANAPWTRPGVASLITGLTPRQHGVQETKDGLSSQVETMAEIFKRAGYETVGFITNGNINREFGFAQGFDRYIALPEDPETRSLHQDASNLRRSATRWLAERSDESPFFLYLHASDPHAPYAPPSPQLERFVSTPVPILETIEYIMEISRLAKPVDTDTLSHLKALYHAEVAYVDEQFGLLLDELENRSLLSNTIVVLTSDHGEEFYEHRWWQHGKTLYDEQLRVPLIIQFHDGRKGARNDRLVEQIDLLPTLFAQLGLPVPHDVAGRDALSDRWHDRPALAVLHRDGRHVESIVHGRFKLIETLSYAHPLGMAPGVQLFDLQHDPGEQHNLALERPVRVGYLRTVMRREQERVGVGLRPETIEMDAETERTLRALGYIE